MWVTENLLYPARYRLVKSQAATPKLFVRFCKPLRTVICILKEPELIIFIIIINEQKRRNFETESRSVVETSYRTYTCLQQFVTDRNRVPHHQNLTSN